MCSIQSAPSETILPTRLEEVTKRYVRPKDVSV